MNNDQSRLEFKAVSKAFAGVRVLKQISFDVGAGRTVGLVGENGAGKSTLMNILGGNLASDAGAMRLNGEPYAPRTPQEATRAGVALIHQEGNLFPNLSIAENMFLTAFPTHSGVPLIDVGQLKQRAKALLKQVGLEIAPETLVENLSAGERQLVEIAKALGTNAQLIVFDEPTTSLTSREVERLFELVAQLQARGLSLIFITHNLDHVFRISDDIVVLRDGELVAHGRKSEFTPGRLVSLMVGRSMSQLFPDRTNQEERAASQPAVLEVRGLSQPGIVADISFSLHRGEVVGLAGLMGSGRSELARIICGLDPWQAGEIVLQGKPYRPSPRRNVQSGIAYLSEDRRSDGLCPEASIADNIALVTLERHAGLFGTLAAKVIDPVVNEIRQAVQLTPAARNEAPARTLSGGNQQKVVLAKWLLANPLVFILDEPTRGIDVGAKFEIYQLIHDLAAKGAAILVISSEIEELIGLCDRILVMSRGALRDDIPRAQFNRERIMRAALPDTREGGV